MQEEVRGEVRREKRESEMYNNQRILCDETPYSQT